MPSSERWFRTLKEEAVWLNEYRTFDEAKQDIERYIRFYNTERLHSALGYRSPAEYRATWPGRPRLKKGGAKPIFHP
jgi:transposase InsO family protein